MNDEEKIFVVGHATVEEEQDGKVICERIVPFDDTRKELWLQFPTKSDFSAKEQQVYEILRDSDGNDEVVFIYRMSRHLKDCQETVRLVQILYSWHV